MLVWQMILISVTLLFLLIASYTDLRWREVPDWLSYGLIFSGLGLRLIFSIEYSWTIFLNGLLGFLLCFGIACLFYYTNQWGGGDSKLLMGMGAIIGLGLQSFNLTDFDFSLMLFFLGVLIIGAFFGLFWSLGLVFKNRKSFVTEFKKLLSATKKWQVLVILSSLVFVSLSFWQSYFWPLAIFPVGGFYLLCFVKGTEKSCFVKKIDVGGLVEGDWLAEEVFVDGEKIAEKEKSLDRKEIDRLKRFVREGKLENVSLKEGIPFVPSFLLSYLLIIFGKEVVGWLGLF